MHSKTCHVKTAKSILPTLSGARWHGAPARALAIALGSFLGLGANPLVGKAMADPPRYRIIIIDPADGLPTVTEMHDRLGINNRGECVATFGTAGSGPDGFDFHPSVWLPARNSNYGAPPGMSPGTHALPTDPNGYRFEARKINVDGFVVGRGTVDEGTFAWLWDLNTGASDRIILFVSNQPKDEATDINDAVPPVIVGGAFFMPNPILDIRGFRRVVGGSLEALDRVLAQHNVGRAMAVSNTGFAVGTSQGLGNYQCGQQQDVYRAASWAENTTSANNLPSLGTPEAEAFTVPLGVNNADPSMIVGYGQDPGDLLVPCLERALFWLHAMANPIALPFLIVNGQPVTEDPMRAYAVADPFAGGMILVVGRSFVTNSAVLWRRLNGVWEAINLNTVLSCGAAQWANISHAVDINSCGWIVGIGTLTDGSPRAFVLIPADACPGDIVGLEVSVPDGKVDINDLLYVINKWGTSDCIANVDGDGAVNVNDLLAVITHWGACACFPTQGAVESLSQELADAGLSQADWNEFLDVMANGTQSEKENYNCWMQRYLTHCVKCPACPGRDPFSN